MGLSEFWWFVIKDGKRNQVGEATSITAKQLNQSPDISQFESDPRIYKIKPEDKGCTLKLKCRPIRVDGYKGEVFTSKAHEII